MSICPDPDKPIEASVHHSALNLAGKSNICIYFICGGRLIKTEQSWSSDFWIPKAVSTVLLLLTMVVCFFQPMGSGINGVIGVAAPGPVTGAGREGWGPARARPWPGSLAKGQARKCGDAVSSAVLVSVLSVPGEIRWSLKKKKKKKMKNIAFG